MEVEQRGTREDRHCVEDLHAVRDDGPEPLLRAHPQSVSDFLHALELVEIDVFDLVQVGYEH